ncbi:MAG: type I restriction enzyme HsdR N-terminal domain-containing protein [Sarcina sp.]
MNKKEVKILKDKLFEISNNIMEIKSNIITEEATKQALILPFFQVLKYDVFNPVEFVPECAADFGVKKGEKVDYAIKLESEIAILIEAKSCNVKLDKHAGQLSRYFNNASAPIGILTNGVEYRFFSDIEASNRMDEEAFCIINMLELKDSDVEFLYRFLKGEFSEEKIREIAHDLKERKKIKDIINHELEDPSEELISVIMSSVNNKRKTGAYFSKYKPMVKDMLDEKIKEVAIDKITNEITEPLDIKPINKVVTTEEELVAYGIILGLLGEYIDVGNICYKDTESYFNILLINNVRRWICRLFLNGSKKYIMFPDNSEKILMDDIGDISKHKERILNSLKMRVDEVNNK